MAKKDIIKSIAPVLDSIINNRKQISKIAEDLDTLFDEGKQSDVDANRINNLFAAEACIKEAEAFLSQI